MHVHGWNTRCEDPQGDIYWQSILWIYSHSCYPHLYALLMDWILSQLLHLTTTIAQRWKHSKRNWGDVTLPSSLFPGFESHWGYFFYCIEPDIGDTEAAVIASFATITAQDAKAKSQILVYIVETQCWQCMIILKKSLRNDCKRKPIISYSLLSDASMSCFCSTYSEYNIIRVVGYSATASSSLYTNPQPFIKKH